MYIKDDIAFAGDTPELLEVTKIKPQESYRLKVMFNNGQTAI